MASFLPGSLRPTIHRHPTCFYKHGHGAENNATASRRCQWVLPLGKLLVPARGQMCFTAGEPDRPLALAAPAKEASRLEPVEHGGLRNTEQMGGFLRGNASGFFDRQSLPGGHSMCEGLCEPVLPAIH